MGVGAAGFSDLNRLLVIGTEAAVADYLEESDSLGRLMDRRRRDVFGSTAFYLRRKIWSWLLKH
jgi:hypothetical protein